MSVEKIAARIDAAMGRVPVDTVFAHARIVDVYGHRVVAGSVAVKDGEIVAVLFAGRDDDAESGGIYAAQAAQVIDCQGRYLAPGLIDGHLHMESSNVRPAEYAKMALARGTTTAIADSHEIANVCGLDGLRFMIEDARRAPLNARFMMPSCVPALPDEQAGASITAADMQTFFAQYPEDIFGLGEMMNMPGVTGADPETLARIDAAALTASGMTDGHAPLVAGPELNAYAAAGIMADHECTNPDEALDKLSRGMYIMLREGTCSHDLEALAPLVLDDPARARRCCLATDDRAPSDALATGMIDNAVRLAIEKGIDPLDALAMGTLSTAEAFGLDHGCGRAGALVGSVAPGKRADLLVLDDLSFANPPAQVYAAGALVAERGSFVGEISPASAEVERLEELLRGSVKLPRLTEDTFAYAFDPAMPVIGVTPANAITAEVRAQSADGLRRLVLIERHGRGAAAQDQGAGEKDLWGKHIGRGWVSGYNVAQGAVAATIGHDSHNVCVVGDNPADMLAAVNAVGQGGAVAVSGGNVVARLDLPLGGLMGDKDAAAVAAEHDAFVRAVRGMGVKPPVDPLMGLIFLPLPVIPTLRIRPEGVFDVRTFQYAGCC